MPKLFQAGDIVTCNFPIQENPVEWTRRPALILKVEYEGTIPIFTVAKITTTDKRPKFIGRWVEKKSAAGKSMGLTEDSFIHLQNIARIKLTAKLVYMGHCSIFDEIEQACSKNGIKY